MMAFCMTCMQSVYAEYTEDHFEANLKAGGQSSSFSPDKEWLEFWVCYYNKAGNDTWLTSGIYVYVDDELVCITNPGITGEDCDEWGIGREDSGSFTSQKNGKIYYYAKKCGYNTGHCGSDAWVDLRLKFDHQSYGVNHTVKFGANYRPNRDGSRWGEESFSISTNWTPVAGSSSDAVMSSSGNHVGTYKFKHGDYSNNQHVNIYGSDISFPSVNGKKIENWGWLSQGTALGTQVNGTSGKDYTASFTVASNYEPQLIYPRIVLDGKGGSFHHRSASKWTAHYPRAKKIKVEPNYWTKEVKVVWESETYDREKSALSTDGVWMICRKESGSNEMKFLKSVGYKDRQCKLPASDAPEYDKQYTYYVSFVPKSWGTEYDSRVGEYYAEDLASSTGCQMVRSFSMTSLDASINATNLKLTWNCSAMQLESPARFEILQSVNGGDWVTISDNIVTEKGKVSYSYDGTVNNAADLYTYKIRIEMLESVFTSEEKTAYSTSLSHITDLIATKGAYNNNVTLRWDVAQIDESNTYFRIERRVHSDGNEESAWRELASMQGQDDTYNYIDNTALNGIFYDYRVTSFCKNSQKKSVNENALTDIGFCTQTGTISGKIAFDGGTAVESVRVMLERTDDGGTASAQSMACDASAKALEWVMEPTQFDKVFGTGQYTVQMFLSPGSTTQSKGNIVLRIGDHGLSLGSYNAQQDVFSLVHTQKGQSTPISGISIPANGFSHLTLAAANGKWTICSIVGEEMKTATVNVSQRNAAGQTTDCHFEAGSYFSGNLDDIRIYNRTLSEEEIKRDYNHYLSGKERGLVAYWHFDDGFNNQHEAYDHSFTSGDANNNHVSINSAEFNSLVPDASQLSYAAVTDANGDYLIQGVPYYEGGTNYTVRPVFNAHIFSPISKTAYFSDNSLVFGGTDFTDVSSFPVSGYIYYENTNCPVDGVTISIDSNPATREGNLITTDANGYFEVNVPIGNHYITVSKTGHEFASSGRYPATGLHRFDREIRNLTFSDQTLITLAGRIDGGNIEYDKPLGFGSSVNNIGRAEITLTSPYMLNAGKEVTGNSVQFVPATEVRHFDIATQSVQSPAQTGAGTTDAASTITIITDSLSGEFAVKLPPLDYRIQSIKVRSNPDLKFSSVQFPEVLNATNVDFAYKDSLEAGGPYFEYNTNYKLAYISEPKFSIIDKSGAPGAYGEKVFSYYENEDDEEEKSFDLYTATDGNVHYTYDYPIFMQMNRYKMSVDGYEEYHNYDANRQKPLVSKVPLEGVTVTISNEMAAGNYISLETGELIQVVDNVFELDSVGHADYVFDAGFPRVSAPHTLTMSASFKVGGQDYPWQPEGTADGTFRGIVLGNRTYGSNFVTAGPDRVIMVLRDPPGSKSSSSWSKGTTISTTHESKRVLTEQQGLETSTDCGFKTETVLGTMAAGTIMSTKSVFTATDAVSATEAWAWNHKTVYTTTINQTVSTSGDPLLVGPDADVFVGYSTNTLFGKAQKVGLFKSPGSIPELAVKDIIVMGDTMTTEFFYTQRHIESILIPNFIELRNSLILPKGTVVTSNSNPYYLYISDVDADSPKFGEEGYYQLIPPATTSDFFCCEDSVLYYNQQIAMWKNEMAKNEQTKLKCIGDPSKYKSQNLSFSSGNTISNSMTISNTTHDDDSFDVTANVTFKFKKLLKICEVGFDTQLTISETGLWHTASAQDTITTTTYSYSLQDGDPYDAITVDVYEAPDHGGPLFVTRGGQTSGPWEPQQVTKYATPLGTEISAATMKNYVPKIYSKGDDILTNVPNTQPALVHLSLVNESETGCPGSFLFRVNPKSNTEGVAVYVGGQPMMTGQSYWLPASVPYDMVVEVRSVDQAQLDCDLEFQLLDNSQSSSASVMGCNLDSYPVRISFVPGSSPIDIAADKPIMNSTNGAEVNLTLSGYDLNLENLLNVYLQYRGESDAAWTTVKRWKCKESGTDNDDDDLLKTSSVVFSLDMANTKVYPDQTYYFRGCTMSKYGNETVWNYSDEQTLLKDMLPPALMGNVSPSNGIYNYNTEIYLNFNEDIRSELINKLDNVKLLGELNDGKISHETSLACDGGEGYRTESKLPLPSDRMAVNAWVKWTGQPGSIVAHGTASKNLSIGVADETGRFYVKVGDGTYYSVKTLPKDEWLFLNVTFDGSDETNPVVNVDYATADETVSLMTDQIIETIVTIPANVVVGYQFDGCIHDLCIWDYPRQFNVAVSESEKNFNQFTPHLIAYWPLDEGHGQLASEKVSEMNLVIGDGSHWHLENVNYSLRIDLDKPVQIVPSSSAVTHDDEDYLLQFWFRTDAEVKNSAVNGVRPNVCNTGNNATHLAIDTETGHLCVEIGDEIKLVLGQKDVCDNQWHNFSMMVHKSTNANANFYIDGNNVGQIASARISNLIGPLVFGGSGWSGYIDEVRVWHGKYTDEIINSTLYTRFNTDNSQLALYYPFEVEELDEYNQPQMHFSPVDRGLYGENETRMVATVFDDSQAVLSGSKDIAPALHSMPVMQDVKFDLVCSDRRVALKITENPARIEGCTLVATVRDVRDKANNPITPISWSFTVMHDFIKWNNQSIEGVFTRQDFDSNIGIHYFASISNNTGEAQEWSLDGLPAWIQASVTGGTLNPSEQKEIDFLIHPSVGIGTHEGYIYLVESNGISHKLPYSLTYLINDPDWMPSVSNYANSMNVIGQVEMNGIKMENPYSKVAAFDSEGHCVGLASPHYEPRYDAYFYYLTIYGNEATDEPLNFRYYDAQTGVIYPAVDFSVATELTFSPNQVYGSMSEPAIWYPKNLIEQTLRLDSGWNWISFNTFEEEPVEKVFDEYLEYHLMYDGCIQVINNDAVAIHEGDEWGGTLKTVKSGTMYKVEMAEYNRLHRIGEPANTHRQAIDIRQQWNWLGANVSTNMALSTAMADMHPAEGDVIKNRENIAIFSGGGWVGPLVTIEPGVGYFYYSGDSDTKQFTYPTTASATGRMKARRNAGYDDDVNATSANVASETEDTYASSYTGTMTLIAAIETNGRRIADCTLSAFDPQGNMRGINVTQDADDRHLIYIVLHGDDPETLTFHATIGTGESQEEVVFSETLTFSDGVTVGKMSAPLVFSLASSAISDITTDATDAPIYDLLGRKLNNTSLNGIHRGVYIKNNQKLLK